MDFTRWIYDEHIPQSGYVKQWPTSKWCPICNLANVIEGRNVRPLYVPINRSLSGERVVIYVCHKCYSIVKDSKSLTTVEAVKEHYKCHLEFLTHRKELLKASTQF